MRAPGRKPRKLQHGHEHEKRGRSVHEERVQPAQELPQVAVLAAVRRQAKRQEEEGRPEGGPRRRKGARRAGTRLVGV